MHYLMETNTIENSVFSVYYKKEGGSIKFGSWDQNATSSEINFFKTLGVESWKLLAI